MTLQTRIFKTASRLIISGKLIEDGDRILVGFSGGKDSYALLYSLLNFKKKTFLKFEIVVVMIDSGFSFDHALVDTFFDSLQKEFGLVTLVKNTHIYDILKEKFPSDLDNSGKYCFLCSRLRRGVFYSLCSELGCNKLALGHNLDDAIETHMLNIFYGSKDLELRPIYSTDDGKYKVIRPLLFVKEKDVIDYSIERDFRIIKQECPLKKKDSKREYIRNLITELSSSNFMFYESFKNAIYKEYK
jgi:tRNA 2-thiocytidine biosynthesis protein TtcA